jgi:hypothetical protein
MSEVELVRSVKNDCPCIGIATDRKKPPGRWKSDEGLASFVRGDGALCSLDGNEAREGG